MSAIGPGVGAVPGVDLGLQPVAFGQQRGIRGARSRTMASKPAQKARADAGAGQHFVIDEADQRGGDLQAVEGAHGVSASGALSIGIGLINGPEQGQHVAQAAAGVAGLGAQLFGRRAGAVDPQRGVAIPGGADGVPGVAADEQDLARASPSVAGPSA
jgi:hypothetical protein